MEKKEITWTVKILGIIGGALSGISLILPWASYSITNIYPWALSELNIWDYFFIKTMSVGPIQSYNIIFGIFMILTFVFALIAFIVGILGFRHIGVKYCNSFLTAGIMGVVSMVLFIIGISQHPGLINLGYGAGFILIIIGFVLFFIAYGIQKALIPIPKPAVYQQPIYHQPGYQPPAYHQPPSQQQPYFEPTSQKPAHQASSQQQEPQPQFCEDCGTKILPGAKFCSKCGKTF
jgi:hypothetical protein